MPKNAFPNPLVMIILNLLFYKDSKKQQQQLIKN